MIPCKTDKSEFMTLSLLQPTKPTVAYVAAQDEYVVFWLGHCMPMSVALLLAFNKPGQTRTVWPSPEGVDKIVKTIQKLRRTNTISGSFAMSTKTVVGGEPLTIDACLVDNTLHEIERRVREQHVSAHQQYTRQELLAMLDPDDVPVI